MTNVWVPDHGRVQEEMQLAQGQVMKAIAYHRPGVEDLAQTLASLFFDPYAHPITKISSTKADSRPQDFIEFAKEMIADYDKADSKPPKDATPTCDGCGSEEGKSGQQLKSCAKCKSASYCSRECQKSDWKKHKKYCTMMSKEHDPNAVLYQRAMPLRNKD